MRKIEEQMIAAIKAGKNWYKDNTQVSVAAREDGATITSVYLHGNLIAQTGVDGGHHWGFCFCGWNTPTTRSRINAIIKGCIVPYVWVSTMKGQPLLSWRRFGGLLYGYKVIPNNGWFWLPEEATKV